MPETEIFAALYLPYLTLAYQKGIDLALLQGNGSIAQEDLFTEAVKVSLRQKSYEHAALAVGTTKEQMAQVVEKAIAEGQGTAELAKAIRDTFDFNSKVRSLRIARTEVTGTIGSAKRATLRAEGYQQVRWSTVVDGRQRPTHYAANGQTVGINAPFSVGGYSCFHPGDDLLPPHESIQCRCDLVGAGAPEDRVIQLGRMFLRTHSSIENKFVVSLRRAFLSQRDRVLSRLSR